MSARFASARRLAFALAALAPVAAPAQVPAAPAVATPADTFGPLFAAVELARVFPDSKTFADMVPREPAATIMAAYRRERPEGRAALAAFVERHFTAQETAAPAADLRARIRALWPVLARPPLAASADGSALPLPQAYLVPGGRYQEFYYWDSYFSMLGLKADGQQALLESMIANFVALVERYGHVPNGTRSYYVSRSQPPFLPLMLDLSDDRDPALARRRLDAIRAEYGYWMAGAGCAGAAGACRNVVRMPDRSLLNRYWDDRDTPREESYAEDVATAAAAAPRAAALVDRDLRAAAESGWDFSSRWLGDGRTLATIRTTAIVPADLNALLWAEERAIARRCRALRDEACASAFAARATARAAAMRRWLWVPGEGRFADWDRERRAPTASVTAAAVVPLFVGLATPAEAHVTAALVRARLLAPGGLRTTTLRSGQQWDAPNGWAPLQWMAVDGLARYREDALARDIATRWLATVDGFWRRTGRLIEKYDVEEPGRAGGGGEYLVQDGFGWTNGVAAALLDRYGPLVPTIR